MPLFTDEERAQVGTCYKKSGKDAAVLLGLEFVGPKMAAFVKQATALSPHKEVALHCWRGGMRSGSLAWLLSTAGFKVHLLKGGYKAYRQEVLSAFARPAQLVLIGGMTGSGKTDILTELARMGHQVIDLEALAHHKGSAFGSLGQPPQPSTEQFENNLYQQWKDLDFERTLFLEDESFSIGTARIPYPLWLQMREAPVIKIDVPKTERVLRLVKEYAHTGDEAIRAAITRIGKRLGGQHVKTALEALAVRDYATVADVSLTYYDKAYLHGLELRENPQIADIMCEADEPIRNAVAVIEKAKSLGLLK
jgi:tRNA 2-selenouridine synthase